MDQADEEAIAAWREARTDLGIRVEAPYLVAASPDRQATCIAYLPDFGSRRGAAVKSTAVVDDAVFHAVLDRWISLSSAAYGSYKRDAWINLLEELRWSGSGSPRGWTPRYDGQRNGNIQNRRRD